MSGLGELGFLAVSDFEKLFLFLFFGVFGQVKRLMSNVTSKRSCFLLLFSRFPPHLSIHHPLLLVEVSRGIQRCHGDHHLVLSEAHYFDILGDSFRILSSFFFSFLFIAVLAAFDFFFLLLKKISLG